MPENLAGPIPPAPRAPVIALADRRARTRYDQEERHVAPGAYGDTMTPEERLTQSVQRLYMQHERTLSDPDTAEAHTIALDAVLLLVDSMFAKGRLEEELHGKLRRMLTDIQQVPGRL
ncbi:hypothetical protein [Streptomyces olivaceiscleroticus]|uniref:Cell division protein ZapA n=1 Tax=Streptomyces olivaceiscleroticus TaxID=68245 RepID=A0ABP3LHA1_9ACTN